MQRVLFFLSNDLCLDDGYEGSSQWLGKTIYAKKWIKLALVQYNTCIIEVIIKLCFTHKRIKPGNPRIRKYMCHILYKEGLTLSQTRPCLLEESFENAVGKGEIAHNEQFLLFAQCFLLFGTTYLLFWTTF